MAREVGQIMFVSGRLHVESRSPVRSGAGYVIKQRNVQNAHLRGSATARCWQIEGRYKPRAADWRAGFPKRTSTIYLFFCGCDAPRWFSIALGYASVRLIWKEKWDGEWMPHRCTGTSYRLLYENSRIFARGRAIFSSGGTGYVPRLLSPLGVRKIQTGSWRRVCLALNKRSVCHCSGGGMLQNARLHVVPRVLWLFVAVQQWKPKKHVCKQWAGTVPPGFVGPLRVVTGLTFACAHAGLKVTLVWECRYTGQRLCYTFSKKQTGARRANRWMMVRNP